MLNMPQNISLANSYEQIIKDIEKIIELNWFIVLKWHFVQKERLWDWLDENNYKKIEKILNYVELKYKNEILYSNYKNISNKY